MSGTSWIGFLGYRTTEEASSTEEPVQAKTEQTFEIFSQKNLGFCLHTIKAEKGGLITDAVAHSLEVFTLGFQDGSVTVKELVVCDDTQDSFMLDDVSN